MANPSARFDIVANSRVAGAFSRTRSQMSGMRRDMGRMTRGMRDNRRVIQQAGMQLSDFAVQVGGGQSAILAFTQNVPQFVQGFGAVGGVLAALITIGGTLALVMTKTGTSLNDLTPIAGVLADELTSVVAAFTWLKETTLDVANVVVNNLDRMLGALTAITTFLVTKWVVSWALATGAVNLMIGALALLRRALILTGLGAVLVAVGALGWQFTKLVEATGGLGAALNAVGSLALKVFNAMGDGAKALGYRLNAIWLEFRATMASALKWAAEKWSEFVTQFGNVINLTDLMTGGSGDVIDTMGWAAWASSFDAAVARFEGRAQDLHDAANDLNNNAWRPLRKELQTLLDMMNAVDKDGKKIDVRDWFGGAGEEGGSGAKPKDTISELTKRMQDLGSTIKDSMSDSFKSVIEGTKSVTDAFGDMARQIISKLFDILVIQRIVGQFDPTGKTASFGLAGLVGGLLSPIMSFDGGGFTGNGPRSGGLDGKGGFMAMLHPREVVNDLTKSGGGSGGGVVINQAFDFSNADADVEGRVMRMMPQIVNATKGAVVDARRRGGSFAGAFGA